ncbi:MAG TPA: Tim44 domain-containing protein [Xanthobacteraceae bacterium]|jgi:predicted lipid-binding transport protein (Tim44 family)|nr:Tim44 domain-containing protein [Xanthobacteraceae bacterium]
MLRFRARPLLALGALLAVLAFATTDADARAGRGGSFGSRGSQTFSAPPSTGTSPTARPIERSMTQPGQPGGAFAQRPPVSSPAGGFFNRPGFLGGLFAGFLGAGLLGMLFGQGFLGGLAGFASAIGLMLQVGLIVIIGYLVWTWWQRRSQPALASGPALRDYASGNSRSAMGFGLGGGAPRSSARASGTDEVGLTPDDFNAFEKTLGEAQSAYSAEDLARLRRHVTPELLSYFSEELAANASKNVVNRVSDVKLLQGDLAEAWREGDTDYATVAMRFSLNDETLDRDSGRVLQGGPDEATEIWTFMRVRGGHWLASAIQQS